ncbi:hypothetical protein NHQ30_007910 [Ciborinia camelliae]|nr:hypothetical protein NHQ30_007910 [Ciborinia camelliae]
MRIGCRFPGIASASNLWEFSLKNKSGQGFVLGQRYGINSFYRVDGNIAWVMNTNKGYFLKKDVRQFDNSFFGINNFEAAPMDPQQRKLLEVVYECFENAGVSQENISGANVAVYFGNFTEDHIMTQQ